MTDDELLLAANALILKIHTITGWAIPEATVAKILKDQFIKKMQESYVNVNPDEIEFAFRKEGTSIKDWGKSMNLSLIDEVMIPYLETRREISKIEEQKKAKQLEAPKEEMSEQTYQNWYESVAADYASGKIKSIEFLPPMIADWLIGKGEIDHQQFIKTAAIQIGKRLKKEAETDKGKQSDYEVFKSQYENAVKKGDPFYGTWALQVERMAKLIALNNHILQEHEL